MKLKYHSIFVLAITMSIFCGCRSDTTQGMVLSPADNIAPNLSDNQPTDNGKEKLLDMALKISGKKLSTDERGLVTRMFSLNEADLIKGLSVCAEFSNGRYPSSLDHETVIKQTEAWGLSKYGKYDNLPADQKKEIEKKMYDTFFMASYYKRLIKENKGPVYYGDKITAEDSDKVLMRWKISDERYRVIFGDLTTKDVSVEELAELEKLMPK